MRAGGVSRLLAATVAMGFVLAGLAPGVAAPSRGQGWGPLTVLQDAFDVQVVDLASSSNGNTVVSWAGRRDGRYRTFFAVRRGSAPFDPPRQVLPGRITEFVTHGARVTVGSVRGDDFLLRTLRRDASWGPTRTVSEVPVAPGAGSYQLVGHAGGDLAVWWHATDGSTRLVVRRDGSWQQPGRVPIGAGFVESITLDRTGAVDAVYTPPRDMVAARSLRHVRRTPSGVWRPPTTLARGLLTAVSVAANGAGALAVSWLAERDGRTFSLRLRYRFAGGTWGDTFERAARTPEQQPAGLAVAGDGQLAVAWQRTQQGRTDLRYSTRGPGGRWAPVQVLARGGAIGAWYGDLAGNAAGRTAITLPFTSSQPGADVIRCPATGPCGAPERVPEVRYATPDTYVGPRGAVKLLWKAGCKTEACYATSARYIASAP